MPAPAKSAKSSAPGASPQRNAALIRSLLAWYDRHRRRLPWRALPGETPDPYRVWLSEIMLQQTTVATVGPYFHTFTSRWPGFRELAAAPVDEIMSAWAGLGYYSRARNLHACARQVVDLHGGALPASEAQLRALPGIGPYTAAAIAAIAFDLKAAPVDGNIERVLSRVFAIREPLPASKPTLRALAAAIAPERRSGDAAQAMMDLGATICTPRNPACTICPWVEACAAREAGIAADLPARAPKPVRPSRQGAAFLILNPRGDILLERRPGKGLLGGMHGTPTTAWTEGEVADPLAAAPVKAAWQRCSGRVRHVFTHFELELDVYVGRLTDAAARKVAGEWAPPGDLARFALPTLMRKVIRLGLAEAGK